LDFLFNLLGAEVSELAVVSLLALARELELTDVILEELLAVHQFVLNLVLLLLFAHAGLRG